MNDLKIFENKEFGEIRTAVVDDKPMFCLADVCKALEIGNVSQMKTRLKEDGVITNEVIDSLGRKQTAIFVNESNLYKVIFQSRKEAAERFTDWVTGEVLPSIRKTGGYQKPLTPQEMMRLQLGMIDDVSDRVTKLENTMTIDYSQQKTLTDLMSSTVVTWLGGKNTCAYEELSKKVFAEIGRDYKDYFNVNARANTPSLRFEEAVDYIKSWKPSTNTLKLISSLNI
jgi:prophage antirepressor-like protein